VDDASGLTEVAEIVGDVVLHLGGTAGRKARPWDVWDCCQVLLGMGGSHACLMLHALMEAEEDECTVGWFYIDRGLTGFI